MSTGLVLILAGGTLALLAAIFVPLGLLLRRGRRRVERRTAADLAAEPAIRGPESGVYNGGTGGYPTVNGNGKLLLTGQRLIFRIMIGTDVVVPVDKITGIREARSFRRKRVGGKTHLIVQTSAGEVGFYVNDNAAWIAAIQRAAPAGAPRESRPTAPER